MPNYSLNNTVPEPDRSLEDFGFNGMTAHGGHPGVSFPAGTSTNPTLGFADEIVDSSNTTKREWPIPAGGDYGLRKY